MTQLKKSVTRVVPGLLKRNLVVSLYPGGIIGIREARSRREYTLPLITVYRMAIEADREHRRLERARGGPDRDGNPDSRLPLLYERDDVVLPVIKARGQVKRRSTRKMRIPLKVQGGRR
jgi:hypothetical protein